ncbi:hypothetical protein ACI3L1_16325 [Deinococcus sp. SM5_A1]|uniref:hypothetical protein n=1 Tax=Deinococcus sp. SM5_A1 TaxID=3379094 RepID=UPI00385E0828
MIWADHDLGGHSVGGYGLATDHHSAGDALHPGDAVIVIGQQGGVLDVKLWDGA